MGPLQFNVLARATIDGKPVTQPANVKALVIQSLNGLAYPPMHLQSWIALAVKEKPPFSLAVKIDPPEGVPERRPRSPSRPHANQVLPTRLH